MDEPVKRVSVSAGRGGYNVLIGSGIMALLDEKKELIGKERTALIINSTVYRLHEQYIKSYFDKYGNCEIYIMPDGEEHKNYRHAEEVFNWLLEHGFSRNSLVAGVGGGVVGDFAGYVAALFMRGIPVIHIPTTLLAMVDSSIGGKVAVNISSGKNIVGAFHQPELVVSDIRFLSTLPDNEMKNGLAEALKHAFLGESGLLHLFQNNNPETIKKPENLEKLVYLSALFKASIVGQDEKESGIRAILNLGHTVGHAIESLLNYRGISHGEAVALGLKAAIEISFRLGWLSGDEYTGSNNLLERYGLVGKRYDIGHTGVLEHMKYDKKNVGGDIRMVLLKGIGTPVYNQGADEALIRDALEYILK